MGEGRSEGAKARPYKGLVLGLRLGLGQRVSKWELRLPGYFLRNSEQMAIIRQAGLLTAKPVLYVCNVDEGSAATGNALSAKVFERAKAEGAEAIFWCGVS